MMINARTEIINTLNNYGEDRTFIDMNPVDFIKSIAIQSANIAHVGNKRAAVECVHEAATELLDIANNMLGNSVENTTS